MSDFTTESIRLTADRLAYGGRQSGRTTALALLIVGYALSAPGDRIPIIVHDPATRPALTHLEHVIIDILTRMNLHGLKIVDTHEGKALVFNLTDMQEHIRSTR